MQSREHEPRRSVSFYTTPEARAILNGRVYVDLAPERQQLFDYAFAAYVGILPAVPQELPRILSPEEITEHARQTTSDLHIIISTSPTIRGAIADGHFSGTIDVSTPEHLYRLHPWDRSAIQNHTSGQATAISRYTQGQSEERLVLFSPKREPGSARGTNGDIAVFTNIGGAQRTYRDTRDIQNAAAFLTDLRRATPLSS